MTKQEDYDSSLMYEFIIRNKDVYTNTIETMSAKELIDLYKYILIQYSIPTPDSQIYVDVRNDLESRDIIQRFLNGEPEDDITKPKKLSNEEQEVVNQIVAHLERRRFKKEHPLIYKLQRTFSKSRNK